MKRAVIAFALGAAAVTAAPASACEFAAPCEAGVNALPYEPDLPPPQIYEMVKRRNDGGLSLAGFYNEPFVSAELTPPVYEQPEYDAPHVIYSPWGHHHRHVAYYRERYHAGHFHGLIRRY